MESQQETKDYLSSLFTESGAREGQEHPFPMFSEQNLLGQSLNNGQLPLDMNFLGNVMAMQGAEAQTALQTQNQSSLEQQIKLTQLQQLQQLQNHIFQQQLALISGQQSPTSPETATNAQFHGLPTPGSSTELRPQHNNDYVSPMILQYDNPTFPNPAPEELPQSYPVGMDPNQMHPSPHHQPHHPSYHHHGSSSAPAHIAFGIKGPSSQRDLDMDVSPLTSPWMGPHHPHPVNTSMTPLSNPGTPLMAPTGSNSTLLPLPLPQRAPKRTASPNVDETGMRKRPSQSPAIRPVQSQSSVKNIVRRGTKSANSTPIIRGASNGPGRQRRAGSIGENGAPTDTPSPVDLSMPPPAPPASATPPPVLPVNNTNHVNHHRGQLMPMPATPASIMKIGNMGLDGGGLTSPTGPMPTISSNSTGVDKDKGKATISKIKVQDIAPKSGGGKAKKVQSSTAETSPNFKAIRPAGTAPLDMAMPYAPPPAFRKTSHKHAEQKRRDSLKSAYDVLRGLLPPIELPPPSDDQPRTVLPGALPPRGPPKAGATGPNRGVSKLQLLVCGNQYIRILKDRVERRDEEVMKLREEVARLRGLSGISEGIDLTRDVDAGEVASLDYGLVAGTGMEDDEGEEE